MRKRECERCLNGTETCIISNYYSCDRCDAAGDKPPLSAAAKYIFDEWDVETAPMFGVDLSKP